MESKEQIQDFCRRYFNGVEAPILVDQPDFLQVELPRHIDKELTDRPYYWMYIEATNQQVPNSVLSLSFRPDLEIEGVEKMEFVTLGSFRMNKLIESTQKRGRYTRVYQKANLVTGGGSYAPILLTTFKFSFVADRRRDEMVSYAVHLCTGQVVRDVYPFVERIAFDEQPALTATTPTPRYDFQQGYALIKERVTADIEALDHTWAAEADTHLQSELEQLETYYESLGLVNADEGKSDEEKVKKAAMYAAERELRIAELKWRCAPRVGIEPFHFGLLYLWESTWREITSTGNRLSM